jgi:hypothetical protein
MPTVQESAMIVTSKMKFSLGKVCRVSYISTKAEVMKHQSTASDRPAPEVRVVRHSGNAPPQVKLGEGFRWLIS